MLERKYMDVDFEIFLNPQSTDFPKYNMQLGIFLLCLIRHFSAAPLLFLTLQNNKIGEKARLTEHRVQSIF